ncbi:SCO4848 family membrane protein [Kitasatospora sp. NPDC054939]
MKLSRRASWFLTAFGVWSIVIWTTFAKNLWKDSGGQAFVDGDHGQPTAFFWVHLLLAITSLVLGLAVGALGVRGLRSGRRTAE